MIKNKVTNYFMPPAIENSVKETRDGNIMIIENQPKKEIADPTIEVDKYSKFEERQSSCQTQWFQMFTWLHYNER